jgi:pyrroloquinoline quinone biosynthesis protein D
MPPPLPKSEDAVPSLPRHVRRRADPVNGRPLLLYPEGAIELDETAAAILDLCDGRRTMGEIASALAASYEAPRPEIFAYIEECLADLKAKGLLYIKKPGP